MPRAILDQQRIHSAARETIASSHRDIVGEVEAAVAADDIVIVGMGINPFPRKARRLLDAANLPYRYLAYGNYFSQWRRRTALKMWTGWPTFPMIFVKGVLVGGAGDLGRLLKSGELGRLLAAPRGS